ncbi:hypothetical protein ANTPLA_LOCUS1917 [Anthophora plagiata]
MRGPQERSEYQLTAANGTVISTYGTVTLNLHLGLRREFIWRFVVADVSKPIIGVDFLDHFDLMVDIRNRRLVDRMTALTVRGKHADMEVPSVKTVIGTSIYHQLLSRIPELTRPSGTPNQTTHQTLHHIKTTPGPPVSSKPRRLAPDRLRAAKKEFEPAYEGPYAVVRRGDKTFVIIIKDKEVTVSIDRLKPAYILAENKPNSTIQQNQPATQTNITDNIPNEPPRVRRSGRRVRFPDRLQITH